MKTLHRRPRFQAHAISSALALKTAEMVRTPSPSLPPENLLHVWPVSKRMNRSGTGGDDPTLIDRVAS